MTQKAGIRIAESASARRWGGAWRRSRVHGGDAQKPSFLSISSARLKEAGARKRERRIGAILNVLVGVALLKGVELSVRVGERQQQWAEAILSEGVVLMSGDTTQTESSHLSSRDDKRNAPPEHHVGEGIKQRARMLPSLAHGEDASGFTQLARELAWALVRARTRANETKKTARPRDHELCP
ncbi:hypothetical protein DFH06DRAFT_1138648 [Mycena polygramma]|nr:hypothetical protein DFH06DRAFT_1138648 [Mycena polygramma]